jgi:hypothetical protein
MSAPPKIRQNPAKKAINMAEQLPLREPERQNWDFFVNLPNPDRSQAGFAENFPPADAGTPVRVFWGLRRLRRNPLHQAGHPAVWGTAC